jgi:UDP-N-acetylmuramoyl-tripeptide--D-alanyl-D-alanine ligase
MHMFQLGSYRAREQFTWLTAHRGAWIPQILVIVIAGLSLLVAWPSAILAGIIFLILAGVFFPRPNKAKKPLVFTSRVNRMMVTIGVGVVATCLAVALVPPRWSILVACLPVIISPLAVILANVINSPIEAAVRHRYLREAKNLLASHPNLITIGVTGSYGKTSVKYYLATLLRTRFNVLMTPESYNTPMGITKTIRGELRATHEVFIAEMGGRHRGDIREDCDLVNPTIGIITAIGEQHLESFGSLDTIIATTMELAEAVRGKGTLYLNGDNPHLAGNQPDQDRWLYGLEPSNGTFAHDITVSLGGTSYSLTHRGQTINNLTTPLIGSHSIQNLAGAAAVGLDLGLTDIELRAGMKKLEPAPHRLALTRQGPVTIIDDAYNSNPAGAKAALDTLAMFDATKILITPGMVELGERQEALNEEFGAQAVNCDFVYLVGAKQAEPISRGLLGAGYDPAKITVVDDVRQALSQAQALPIDGDRVILLENDLPDNY